VALIKRERRLVEGDFFPHGHCFKKSKIIFMVSKKYEKIPDVDNNLSHKCANVNFKYLVFFATKKITSV
jgi:hypothetical protein